MRRRLAVPFLLLPLAAAGQAAAAPVTWSGNGHVYDTVTVPAGIGWAQAKLATRERGCGWYLATVTSAAEDKFLSALVTHRIDLFVDGHGPWLGAYQHDSKAEPGGDWAWVTGEKFTLTHWNPGKPDNKTGGEPGFEPGIKSGQSEEVLEYLASGFWNDANVTAQAHGYVVEFDKPRQAACRKLG